MDTANLFTWSASVSYGACALIFAILCGRIILLPTAKTGGVRAITLLPCLATALWAGLMSAAFSGLWDIAVLIDLSEISRNLLWLHLLLNLLQRVETGQDVAAPRKRRLTSRVLAPLVIIWVPLAIARHLPLEQESRDLLALFYNAVAMLSMVGGLTLLEALISRTGPSGRWGLKHLCLGLAAIFAFDFCLYTDALLLNRLGADFLVVRGQAGLVAALVLLPSLGRMKSWTREGDSGLNLNTPTSLRGIALMGSGVYLLLMAALGYVLRALGGQWTTTLQISLIFAGLMLLAAFFTSGRFKSQIKLLIHKNFFTYKYDYREEWQRFIRVMSMHQPLSLQERILHAVANMMDSPSGAVWVWHRHEDTFVPEASWNYHGPQPAESSSSSFIDFLRRTGWILDVNEIREQPGKYPELVLPDWIESHAEAWLVVPLIHRNEILGFLTLDNARAPRRLDWEDHDLLKTAAAHSATYLAEELAAEALGDAQRLEEFNRRFAFVAHDIKNVVGQMSLMVENAERFGDNPEFQKDMVETVRNSVLRMRSLLEQLTEKRRQATSQLSELNLAALIESVGARWHKTNANINWARDLPAVQAIGNQENLTNALDLVIDNSQGAIGPEGNIMIQLRQDAKHAIIEVEDDGPGMDADFIQKELFKPLRSTKSNGYGIGAYQIRHLIREMGGQLEVDSERNKGTIMRILLPLSGQTTLPSLTKPSFEKAKPSFEKVSSAP